MFKKFTLAILLLIVFFSFLLNSCNIDFPIGYHIDEVKKVFFIENDQQDFHLPVLMIQIIRFLNIFLKLTSKQDIVVLGRLSSAVFGSLIVFILYFISRLGLSRKYSLLVCLGCAVSPIMAIHSHYLKEDIIFTFFAMCSLFCFFKYLKNKSRLSVIFLGISTGLAFSSHYKSLLFIPIYLISSILISKSVKENIRFFIKLLAALIIAFIVFLIINYPLVFDFGNFIRGISFETSHIFRGHSLKRYPIDDFFLFHFKNSVIPGVTIPVAILGVLFISYSLLKWEKTLWQDKILIFYTLVFYFAVELTPCKPFPGYIRYVIAFTPVLIYFAFKTIFLIGSLGYFYGKKYLILFLGILLIISPLVKTLKLDYYLGKDTRETAEKYFKRSSYSPEYETYAAVNWDMRRVVDKSVEEHRKSNVTHLVASSFQYERYLIGGKLKNQNPEVYVRCKAYTELFKYPYVEIKPDYESFAFSNPTIRVVDIRNNSKKNTKKLKAYKHEK